MVVDNFITSFGRDHGTGNVKHHKLVLGYLIDWNVKVYLVGGPDFDRIRKPGLVGSTPQNSENSLKTAILNASGTKCRHIGHRTG